MLQDLYKGFKKVNEDDSSATLEHENGHSLTIAKSGLNRQQIKALSKLPLHQAKGSEEEVKAPMAAPVDGSTQAKSVGANIASAVTQNILEGATQATTPQQSQYLSPEQIQQMPIPTATSVETGEPVAPAVGATPPEREPTRRQVEGPLPPTFLSAVGAQDMLPNESGIQYQARKQQEYDQWVQSQKERQQQNERIKEYDFAKAATETPEQTVITDQLAQPEQKGLASTEAGLATQQQQPTGSVSQPSAKTAKPFAPAPLPSALRDPYEVLFDPNVPISERHQAGQIVYKGITDRIAKAEQDFQNKMANDEIDNDRVFNNMSTGRKIRTIIGVLLGAAGSGIGGGENLALAMLNKEIERDVEAQKANRESKFNLFKMHLEALNNERAATLQTMNNLRDNADLKMKDMLQSLDPKNLKEKTALQALIAQNQLAKTKAHSEMAQLELENLWKQQEKARSGTGELSYEPKEYRERGFNVMVPDEKGKLVSRRMYATNSQQAEKARQQSAALETVRDVYNRIVQFNTTKGRALTGEERDEAETLNKEMELALAAAKEVNVGEKGLKGLSGLAPIAGKILDFKGQSAKNVAFNRFLNAETVRVIKQFKQ